MGIFTPMLTARFLIFLCLGVALLEGLSQAQDKFSTGKMKWEVLEKKTISLPQLGLSSVLELIPELSGPDPDIEEKHSIHDASAYGMSNDIDLLLKTNDEDGNLMFLTDRYLKFFPSESQGMRVLDKVQRYGGEGTQLATIRYRTQFAPGTSIKATQVSNPTGDKGALALLLIPKKPGQPVTVLFMGGMDDGWTRKIDAGEDYVEWSYTGLLDMGEDFMLLHSVAFCENAEPKTVTAALDKLVNPKGLPADPTLSPSIYQRLINYPVTIKKLEELGADQPVKLVWLDRVLEPLKLKRGEDKDLLQLEGGESVQGSFHVTAMKLGDQELKQENIAAILGEQATRKSRVFLRDGRVLRGRLEWQSAHFESESLGSIVLKADAPGRVVLRRGKNDGVMTAKPVAWMADGREGQMLPMTELPKGLLNLRWIGGAKAVPWQEVVSVRVLPAPAMESEVVLKSGSRWRGWIEGDASSGITVSYWAKDIPSLVQLLGDSPADPAIPNQPAVILQNGSVMIGEAVSDKLPWRKQADDMEIKITDLASVKRVPTRDEEAAPTFELSLENGTKLTGTPREGSLLWRQGPETLRLSWAWIQSIQISVQEAAKKP